MPCNSKFSATLLFVITFSSFRRRNKRLITLTLKSFFVSLSVDLARSSSDSESDSSANSVSSAQRSVILFKK